MSAMRKNHDGATGLWRCSCGQLVWTGGRGYCGSMISAGVPNYECPGCGLPPSPTPWTVVGNVFLMTNGQWRAMIEGHYYASFDESFADADAARAALKAFVRDEAPALEAAGQTRRQAEMAAARQHPFGDLPELVAYKAAVLASREAKAQVEVILDRGKRLAFQQTDRSAGPRCRACGGRSHEAPNQYRGKYHQPGCQEAELSRLEKVAHEASMAVKLAAEVAVKAVNTAIAASDIGRQAAEHGLVVKLLSPDDDHFFVFSGTSQQASGQWGYVVGYFAGTHVTARD